MGFERYQATLAQVDFAGMLGLPPWLPRLPAWRRRAAAALIDRVLESIIARRPASDASGDLLSLLLEARDPETGGMLDARQIRDELSVIVLAGHETTANALSWALYLLSEHPQVAGRLRDEVDGVLAGRPPAFDDLPRLPYTRMVIEEALRLYPPVSVISREATTDDVLCGRPIKAGSLVLVVPWLLHRHRRLWRDPDRFDPERFAPEQTRRRDRYAYVPFGAGPRRCLGGFFAMTEACLILATIAQRVSLTLRPGFRVEPRCRLTLRPARGLPMRVAPR